jgi:hypothetical protein
MTIHPTRQEIVLASHLVITQFRAICEVLEAALNDWGPPVEPTLNTIFCFSDPAFRDHISDAFADAAQERIPFLGFWERSCHQSVRAVGNQITSILLPDRKAFEISFHAVDRASIAEDVTPKRYREFFEASIPPATLEKIKVNWRQSKAKISALGVSGYEGVEFALQRELAQTKRDLQSAVLRQADNFVSAQLEDIRKTIDDSSSKRDEALHEVQSALCVSATLPAQELFPPLPPPIVDRLEEFEKRAAPRVRNLFNTLLNHPGLHEHLRVEHWYFEGADQQLQSGSFTDLVRLLEEALTKWGRESGFKLKRVRGAKNREAKVELVGDRQLLEKVRRKTPSKNAGG